MRRARGQLIFYVAITLGCGGQLLAEPDGGSGVKGDDGRISRDSGGTGVGSSSGAGLDGSAKESSDYVSGSRSGSNTGSAPSSGGPSGAGSGAGASCTLGAKAPDMIPCASTEVCCGAYGSSIIGDAAPTIGVTHVCLPRGQCALAILSCTRASDCAAGQVCCFYFAGIEGGDGAGAVCQPSCGNNGYPLCDEQQCPAGRGDGG
jgi:hypothetical protein